MLNFTPYLLGGAGLCAGIALVFYILWQSSQDTEEVLRREVERLEGVINARNQAIRALSSQRDAGILSDSDTIKLYREASARANGESLPSTDIVDSSAAGEDHLSG